MRLWCHTVLLLLGVLIAVCAHSDERPNFLIIMTDDMGFTDLGAFGGHDIETPNLDELALNGIRFTNFHGHTRCVVSRALLISGTGQHFMFRGSMKLLKESASDWELYDIAADPYERHNLAGDQPELLEELLAELKIQAAKSNILDR